LLCCRASSFEFTIQNYCVVGPHLLSLRYKIVVLWGAHLLCLSYKEVNYPVISQFIKYTKTAKYPLIVQLTRQCLFQM